MSKLAASLLTYADTASVASALLEAAGADLPEPHTIACGIDAEASHRVAGAGSFKAVVTVASSTRDPALLDRLARSSKSGLQVRRAVAANPACSPSTAEYLYRWSIAKEDAECFAAALSKMAAAPALDDHSGIYATTLPKALTGYYPHAALAAAVAAAGDLEVWRRALTAPDAALVYAAAAELTRSPLEGFDVGDALDGVISPGRVQAALGHLASSNRALIDAPLAERLVDDNGWRIQPSSSRSYRNPTLVITSELTASAASVLARSGDEELEKVAASQPLSGPDRAHLIAVGHINALHRLASSGQLDCDEVVALCARDGADNSAYAALCNTDGLTRTARVAAATALNDVGLANWLLSHRVTGRGHNHPEPGDIAEVLGARPHALVASSVLNQFHKVATAPWSDELVEHCPGLLGAWRPGNHPDATIYRLLRHHLGEATTAWSTMCAMAGTWDGSLVALAETVRTLTEPAALPVAPDNGEVPASAVLGAQLDLWATLS